MQPMTYAQACDTYTDILLDRAKMHSVSLFNIISESITDATIVDDLGDLINQWQDERKAIVEELRG